VLTANQLDHLFKEYAKQDYSFFLEYITHNQYQHAKHTLYLCDVLQKVERGEIKRLIVSMPPRHSKSETITKFFPVWYLGRNPDKEVMIASYSAELASEFSRFSRNVMEESGQDLFGINVSRDSRAANRWGIQGTRGGLFSCGVGGSATGRGYSLGIIDDPVKNFEEANSPVYQQKIIDWYKSVFRTRTAPNAAIILVMTRWSQNDLAGYLINEMKNGGEEWTVISLPAQAEEDDILGRAPGEWLWPERFTPEEYEDFRKSLGSRIWQGLYQQNPTPAGGNVFQRSWFKFYKTLPEMDRTLVSIDATFKDSKDSDYVVFQYWGQKGPDFYLIDQVRDRMDFVTTITMLEAFLKKNKTRTILIEDKANGSAIISTLKRKFSGIIPINPTASKESRAQAVAPLFEAGNVYLPEDAPYILDYIEEMVAFPNGSHDDQVDGTSQAINYALENGNRMSVQEAVDFRRFLGI